MNEWVWIDSAVLLAVHDQQLAEHGGASGVRDVGLFQSAVARPMQIAAYGDPDTFELAAAYCYGIAKNHPFIDGNKRTAFVAMEMFLMLNGFELSANDIECIVTMLSVAAGDTSDGELAAWIRANSKAT